MVTKHIGAISEQGPVRSANEDACWVSGPHDPVELGELYIVADGVGGQKYGAAAAQQATQVIPELFYKLRQSGEDVGSALSKAIYLANESIHERSQVLGNVKMGCTVVVGVQHEGQLYIAHVGDARAYLLRNRDLQQLTRDDTWVQKQLDAGILTPEEAERHEFRNVVTQVLGNTLNIEVHQSAPRPISPADKLLLCSDGLHGVLSDDQLTKLLRADAPPVAAKSLVKAAVSAGTRDNVTAVVVDLQPLPAQGIWAQLQQKRVPLAIMALLLCVAFFVALGINALGLADRAVRSDEPDSIQVIETAVIPTLVATAVLPTPTPIPATESPATPIPATAPLILTDTPPPATNTPVPTNTAPPLPTSTASSPATGTIIGSAFLWTDDQIEARRCGQFSDMPLSDGEAVQIIDATPITINGPDSDCQPNEFIKVQVIANPEQIGWVLAYSVEVTAVTPPEDESP